MGFYKGTEKIFPAVVFTNFFPVRFYLTDICCAMAYDRSKRSYGRKNTKKQEVLMGRPGIMRYFDILEPVLMLNNTERENC